MGKKRIHLATLRVIGRRMATGPVLLRLWLVPLTGALLVVTRDPAHARFGWLAVFITIVFWVLDAHFSRQARLFRKNHDRVLATPEAEVDLLLDTSSVDGPDASIGTMMFSTAPLVYYSLVLAVIVVVRSVLHFA